LPILVSCSGGNARAEEGDRVSVHYRGTLDSGEVFDSSYDRGDPIFFVVGGGQMISGFDNAVSGMAVGEKKTVRLEPDEAYGQRRDNLIFDVPLSQAPPGLSVGDSVTLSSGGQAVVLEITDEIVRVDANHRLAEQTLTFEIELVSIE
jgi:FKBP-type peptidyl-prolyl cis-trans isomerase 2